MATFAVPRGEPVFRKEDCSPFDVGLVFSAIARFSDAEKLQFINNIWKPDALYEFPVSLETGEKLRKFRHDWLVRFPWLAYSKYLDVFSVCLVSALVWSVERMVPGWISFFDLR